jgi:hypothetical protein
VRCPEDPVTLFLFFFLFFPHSLFFLFSFLSRLRAGRFCRGELRSPTGNNCPTGNNRPARFLGIWSDFWVVWAHAMRPYGFLGYLGARNAPLRVFGLFGRTQCAPTGLGAVFGDLGFLGAVFGLFGRTQYAPTL